MDFPSLLGPPLKAPGNRIARLVGSLAPDWSALWFDQGMHSSAPVGEWVERCLRDVLNVDTPVLFKDLLLPTFVVSTDLVRREAKIWSTIHTPNDSVSHAVRASCSIPLFFQPVGDWLVDGGVLSNLPAFVFGTDRPRNLSSRILAFSVIGDTTGAPGERSTIAYLNSLVDTVTSGATKLQSALQPDIHTIEIAAEGVNATDFHKVTPEVTERLIENGSKATSKFLDEELLRLRPRRSVDGVCLDKDELYARVVFASRAPLSRVIISENKTDWVYALFPTLFTLRNRGTDLVVILPEHGRQLTACALPEGFARRAWSPRAHSERRKRRASTSVGLSSDRP